MDINLIFLKENKPEHFSEDVDFSSLELKNLNIKSIDKCHVEVDACQYEGLLRVTVDVKADCTCICAYTLEDVPYTVKTSDELDILDEDDEDDESKYLIEKNVLHLDEYILALILSSIPKKVIKKGAKRPEAGEGYRVISEEELMIERSKKKNTAFDVLDSLEFDE